MGLTPGSPNPNPGLLAAQGTGKGGTPPMGGIQYGPSIPALASLIQGFQGGNGYMQGPNYGGYGMPQPQFASNMRYGTPQGPNNFYQPQVPPGYYRPQGAMTRFQPGAQGQGLPQMPQGNVYIPPNQPNQPQAVPPTPAPTPAPTPVAPPVAPQPTPLQNYQAQLPANQVMPGGPAAINAASAMTAPPGTPAGTPVPGMPGMFFNQFGGTYSVGLPAGTQAWLANSR